MDASLLIASRAEGRFSGPSARSKVEASGLAYEAYGHAVAQTEAPRNAVELASRHPRHPQMKFSELTPLSEAEHATKFRRPASKENHDKRRNEYRNVITLHEGMLRRDPSFRPSDLSCGSSHRPSSISSGTFASLIATSCPPHEQRPGAQNSRKPFRLPSKL